MQLVSLCVKIKLSFHLIEFGLLCSRHSLPMPGNILWSFNTCSSSHSLYTSHRIRCLIKNKYKNKNIYNFFSVFFVEATTPSSFGWWHAFISAFSVLFARWLMGLAAWLIIQVILLEIITVSIVSLKRALEQQKNKKIMGKWMSNLEWIVLLLQKNKESIHKQH